jgi:hypothetical protein
MHTSQNLIGIATLAAMLAVAGEVQSAEKAPACNPSAGRASARIECLTKITQALTTKIDALQANLAQQAEALNSSNYVRRSDLDGYLGAYVKYNAPLAIDMAANPGAGQSNGHCLTADLDTDAVMIEDSCNFNAKPELKWRLLSAVQSSAENR